MGNSTTSDLFGILGIKMKPDYNEKLAGVASPYTNVFGKTFGDETTVSQVNNNGLEIIRMGASATFSEMNHKGFIKVAFRKDCYETRTFRFNKKEIRVIANYLNSILEDEEDG